jgi:hypothetical protein
MRALAPSDHTGDTFAHDTLCLKAAARAQDIVAAFFECDLLDVTFELESPVGERGFADLMLSVDCCPVLCLEVKTENDKQHPGGWLRQVKCYSADDLTPLQALYFDAAQMPVLDMRTMERVAGPGSPNCWGF